MALSDFQTRKLTHMFNMYDVDHKGTIDQADYERRAEYLAEYRGYEKGSTEYLNLRQRIMADWQQFSLYVDTDANDHITLAEFLEYADYILTDKSLWHENSVETAKFMIEVCDADGDGRVTLDEYMIFFKSFELEEASIQFAFEKLDADGDGLVTEDEIVKALDQFGQSNQPNDAGNFMFGPLD